MNRKTVLTTLGVGTLISIYSCAKPNLEEFQKTKEQESYKYHIMDDTNGIGSIVSFGPDNVKEGEIVSPYIKIKTNKDVEIIDVNDTSKNVIESGNYKVGKSLKKDQELLITLPAIKFKVSSLNSLYNQTLVGNTKVGKVNYTFKVNYKTNVSPKPTQTPSPIPATENISISDFICQYAGKYNSNGKVSKFNGYYIAENIGGTDFKISGKGLSGSSVSIDNSNYELTDIKVSSSEISGKIKAKLTAIDTNIVFTVSTSKGKFTLNKKFIPAFKKREWGQCTAWATKRKLESANPTLQSGDAYSDGKNINVSYVPQAGDILYWGNPHQAFIESVNLTTSTINNKDGTKKITDSYTINLSQFNADIDLSESLGYFTTKFEVEKSLDKNGKIIASSLKQMPKFSSSSKCPDASAYFR